MSDHTADSGDRWTIRGVTEEAKSAARMAADREHQSLGKWLSRAILLQAGADMTADRAPAIVRHDAAAPAEQAPDLEEIERTVAMIRELAASGAEVPRSVARTAYGLLRVRLQALRRQTKTSQSRTKPGAPADIGGSAGLAAVPEP